MAMLAVLIVALRNMAVMLMVAERSHRQVTLMATEDPLTGALNRGGLSRSYAAMRGTVTALLIDMDHFKAVNDMHGHAAGDRLLCTLVDALRATSPPNSVITRMGGDEFVLLLEECSVDQAANLAVGIRDEFAVAIRGRDFPVTLSIGISRQSSQDELDRLLQNADAALYESKRQGRNCVEFYQENANAA